jgi:hypothetical protein
MSLIKAITNNTNLTIGAIRSFLTVNTASGVTSLSIKNITSFADNQIIVVGQFGNEGTEILTINGTPSGSTLTLDNATTFPHSADSPVIVIDFDQVEFSHSVTVGGSKTVMATVNMVVDTPDFTRYNDITYTTGYYYIRFKNSITNVFSDYSDPIPVSGYTQFTARYLIDAALGGINKKTSDVLSDSFAFVEIDNCQMETLRELKRWSFLQKFDEIIGQLSVGGWKIAIPDDLDDQFTNKSIFHIKIGREFTLEWIDKDRWNKLTSGMAYTTLASPIAVSDATITLTDSSDFDSGGVVKIGANDYTFTANDTTTGILTLDSVSTTTNTAGEDAFEFALTGLPTCFTIFGGYIWFDRVISDTYDGRNVYMDYYKKVESITTDSQEIVLADPLIVQYYLQYKFLLKLNNGEESPASSAMYTKYLKRVEKLKQKEVLGTLYIQRPRINNWALRSQIGYNDGRRIRDGAFENI